MSQPFERVPDVDPVTPRVSTTRGRHGRDVRGPLVLPGPLSPAGRSPRLAPRTEFDELVLAVVERLARRWHSEWGDVEFATEDIPQLPPDWVDEPVPFGSLVRGSGTTPTRIVLFRRPIEMRAKSRLERVALVTEVLAEHIAELLGRDPSEIAES